MQMEVYNENERNIALPIRPNTLYEYRYRFNEMKKRIVSCVLALCLLLAGCAGEQKEKAVTATRFESEEPMPGFDVQNQYMLSIAISFQEGEGFSAEAI